MAYVCKQEFGKRNKAGAGMRFETKVYVLASGEFVFYGIPENIQRMLGNAKERLRLNQRVHKIGLHVHNMADGIKAIKAAMNTLLKEVATEELVLRYNYTATCHYYVGADGKLYANGGICEERCGEEYDGKGWSLSVIDGKEELSSSWTTGEWLVGFMANVEEKITYTTGKKSNVEYRPPNKDNLGEWGEKLNEFVNTRMAGKPKEMPYTEEVARIFCESMWKLCELAQKLTYFLSEPENILKGTGQFLLSGEKKPLES